MGKKVKKVASVVASPVAALNVIGGNRLLGLFGTDVPEPGKPPNAQLQEAKEIAASRSEELKKRKRVNLLTSPGGALLTSESLAGPSLQLGQ